MSDPLLTVCPECGQDTYTKQVTAAGFQLKGSGWYVTDFRNNGGAAGTGVPAPATAGTDAGGSAAASGGNAASAGTAGSSATPASAPAAAAPAGSPST